MICFTTSWLTDHGTGDRSEVTKYIGAAELAVGSRGNEIYLLPITVTETFVALLRLMTWEARRQRRI